MKSIMELFFPAKKKYSFTVIKWVTYGITFLVSLILSLTFYPIISEVSKFAAIIAVLAIIILMVVIIGNYIAAFIINDIKNRQF